MGLPTLPACGQPATQRIEIYAPAGGRAHGSLDGVWYGCPAHAGPARDAVGAAGLTAFTLPAGARERLAHCGDGVDYTGVRAVYLRAPESPHRETTAGELPPGRCMLLWPGGSPTPARVLSERDGGMVAIEYDDIRVPVLYRPDHPMRVLDSVPPPPAPVPPADPRDAVIAAAREVRDAWYADHPAGVDTTSVMGLTIGTLDAALTRLDSLSHSRPVEPEQPSVTCAAGRACTGRDGTPSPYACEVCGHCAEHGHGGCAARTDTGRCGCTGGGA